MSTRCATSFTFLAGEYVIQAYATILNRTSPVLLFTVRLSRSDELAKALLDHAKGVLFTWSPDSRIYHGIVSELIAGEGHSRSVSVAGHGKLPSA